MRSLVCLLVVTFVIFSCSPPPLELKNARPSPPEREQLDQWLAARESAVEGIRPGVEAGIVWAHPELRDKTEVSIVYLPGFTATRGEISPVAERIAQELGANLYFSRPTGQGVGPDGHRTVTAADWVADGLEAWDIGQKLGNRVVVLGVSTGGTLATWLVLGPAALRPAATILVSPNLTPKNQRSEMLLWPVAEWLLPLMLGNTVHVESRNELQAKYWDTTRSSHSLIPMMQLVEGARTRDFTRWSTPLLVVYDNLDNVVDESVTVKLFSKAPVDTVEMLPWIAAEGDDHHVLAGEAMSPGGTQKMVDLSVDYLRRVLSLVER